MAEFVTLDNVFDKVNEEEEEQQQQLQPPENMPTNTLSDIIRTFDLEKLTQAEEQQQEQQLQFPTITNPTTVEIPEEGIIITLAESPEDQAAASPVDENEGKEIMKGITGFDRLPLGGAVAGNTSATPVFTMQRPFVKILEQPATNKLRFRYKCEGRSAGALQGASTTAENRSYPTIQIVGYEGPAVVVVSCVEEKPPHRTHPHNLVGKSGMCKKGVCSMDVNTSDMTCVFQNIGIQCVTKRDAPESLSLREEIKVDPFKQGFKHKHSSINLNCIRLCFQVFLKTGSANLIPLDAVVSNIIRDKKAHTDLQILEHSDDKAPVEGGKKIMLFCEKVYKEDIEVHFSFVTKSGEPVTCKGEFTANDVHKQYGICLKTPPFPDQSITEPVQVSMYLFKPSDQSQSDPIPFWYMPNQISSMPPQKPIMKRNRAAKANDEQSSGRVTVPPKVRDNGGHVMVMEGGRSQAPAQQMLIVDKIINATMPSKQQANTPSSNGGQMLPPAVQQPSVKAGGINMTAELQNMVQQDQFQQQQQNFAAAMQMNMPTAHAGATQQQQAPAANVEMLPDLQLSDFSDLNNLSVNTDELANLENLSSNLNISLKLDKKSPQGHSPLLAQAPQLQQQQQQQHNSTQLDTPDVSMSAGADDKPSSSYRRNNLNKF